MCSGGYELGHDDRSWIWLCRQTSFLLACICSIPCLISRCLSIRTEDVQFRLKHLYVSDQSMP